MTGGYRQYQAVAADLSRLVITDSLQDNDPAFYANVQQLVTDAAAGRHLPPVDRAGYRAGMAVLAQAGCDALADSYDKALTGVGDLVTFNTAISSWDTTAPA